MAVGPKRATAQIGAKLLLDEGAAQPVTMKFVGLDANRISTRQRERSERGSGRSVRLNWVGNLGPKAPLVFRQIEPCVT
jgi:hypothetical protein